MSSKICDSKCGLNNCVQSIENRPVYCLIVNQVRAARTIAELNEIEKKYRRRLNNMRLSKCEKENGNYHSIIAAFIYYKNQILGG